MMHATTSPLYAIIASNDIASAMMDGAGGTLLTWALDETLLAAELLTVTFLTATGTGLVPSVVIYTYFGHALFSVATQDRQAVIRNLVLTVTLLLLLTFIVPLRARWKRRRYRNRR